MTFAEGERRTVEAILPPVSSRQPPPPGPIQDRGETSNTTVGARTWVLIGEATATLTFLGMGIGYSIAKSSANRRLQRSQENIDRIDRSAGACLSPQGALMGYCADLSQALDDRQRADNLATAGFAAAAVGAAATVLTWWLWPEPEKNHASLRVSLGVRPSGAGASLLTRF
jgi:hypothetical protein